MEILSFTLGILSIIAAALVVMLVWGTVRVVKQQREIKIIWERINEQDQTFWRMREDDDRKTQQKENDLLRDLDCRFNDCLMESKSYTDSRFDKTKQLIKG